MTPSVDWQQKSVTSVERTEQPRFSQNAILRFIVLAGLLALSVNALNGQSDALFINDKGNVGIGTSTPGFPLTFPDSVGDKISLWGQNGAHFGFGIDHGKLQIYTNGTGSDIVLGYGSSGASPTLTEADPKIFHETMRIKGNGNVGIGTPSPGAKLQVLGTTSLSNGTGESWFPYTDGNSYVSGTNVIFRSSGNQERMRIADSGNVGIGTSTPGPNSKLDVNGNENVNGDVAINGKSAIRGNDDYLRLNQDGKFAKGVHTPTASSSMSLNVGGVAGWANPGDGNVEVSGRVRVRGALYVDGGLYYYWGAQPSPGWRNIQDKAFDTAGSVKTGAPSEPSDLRLKMDVRSIPSALDKIHSLRGVTYRWNGDALRYFTRDIESTLSAGPEATEKENHDLWQKERDKRYEELGKTQVGVVAQDVEAVLPEAVTADESGYKSVKYYELIPLMIQALKEEDRITRVQAQTIARQQNEIQRLTAAAQITQQQLTELSDLKQQLESLLANADKIKSVNLNSTSANQARAGSHSSRSE
jgi:hypothetical protein